MDSLDDRDLEQKKLEGTFPQMEASGSAGIFLIKTNLFGSEVALFHNLDRLLSFVVTALTIGTTQSQAPVGFCQSTPISKSQQACPTFSKRIACSPFSAGSQDPW